MKQHAFIKISEHAVTRYRERIGPLPEDDAESRIALFGKLFEAKPKHFKDLKRLKEKRTSIIPAPACVFVISLGTVVTVLSRDPALNGPRGAAAIEQVLAQEASA